MVTKREKLTISVPITLLAVADKMAAEMKISSSKVISMCIQEIAEKRKDEAMKEGYLAMASQHEEFAQITSGILQETVSEWK
jgi:metal-responsive CopG/Arc/MetJ family transcriptional regulator